MARRIDPTGLVGHARGEIELDGKVLVIKRIHVIYSGLRFTDDDREVLQRVLDTHAQGCPVARSVGAAIDITTSVDGL
jgi:uncharacterized OsmC-like protein